MTADSGPHITEEMRRVIGVESAPEYIDIDRTVVKRVVEVLSDKNPLWSDDEFAKSTSLGGTVAFPVALHPSLPNVTMPNYQNPFSGGSTLSGDEWEFLEPLRPGDRLAATGKIAGFEEVEGRRRLLFSTIEYTYRNQHGRVAMIARRTTVHFPPKAES